MLALPARAESTAAGWLPLSEGVLELASSWA